MIQCFRTVIFSYCDIVICFKLHDATSFLSDAHEVSTPALPSSK